MSYTSTAQYTTCLPELQLEGNCGYRIDGSRITLNIDSILNNRPSDNCSGTLSLELWALDQPYHGGHFNGQIIAGQEIGTLQGQHEFNGVSRLLDFQAPQSGNWVLCLMLREWNGQAFETVDYRNFAQQYVVTAREQAPAAQAPAAAPAASTTGAESKVVHLPKREDDGRISLNQATTSDIAALKGVSAKLAEKIVAGRPYQSIDGLLLIKGIGEKLLNRLREFIRL